MNIWWKIYFWIFTVLTVIGMLMMITMISKLSLGDWISFLSSPLGIAILYSFTFQKKTFSAKVWNIIFWIIVGSSLLTLVDIISGEAISRAIPLLSSNLIGQTEAILGLVLGLPLIYANYKISKSEFKYSK